VIEHVGDRHLLLLTDYDGTLSELAPTPDEAVVSDAVRTDVMALAGDVSVTFGVVSGRRLLDVAARVGTSATYVAGLHGLEIAGPGTAFRHPVLDQAKPIIHRLAQASAAELAWCPGIRLENKTYALTCHVRMAPPEFTERALGMFEAIAEPELESGVLRAMAGAMAIELLPAVDWHKGRACEWIRERVASRIGASPAIVYLGDDRTDEDAFAVLRDDDVVLGVGDRPHAQLIDWRLAGPASVGRFFGELVRCRRDRARV
jgi:trehalose-phosphatase